MKFENKTIVNTLKKYFKGQGYSRLGGTVLVNGKNNNVIYLINNMNFFFMARQP
jgi:hypothetical protein